MLKPNQIPGMYRKSRNPFSESGRSHVDELIFDAERVGKVAIPSVNQVVLMYVHVLHSGCFGSSVAIPSVNQVVLISSIIPGMGVSDISCRNPFSESGRSHGENMFYMGSTKISSQSLQ